MSSKKILLVDDESDILDFLSYNLKSAGYSVKVASNGEEGIAIAIEFEPDLILLDMMMPEMDSVKYGKQCLIWNVTCNMAFQLLKEIIFSEIMMLLKIDGIPYKQIHLVNIWENLMRQNLWTGPK